MRIVFITHPDPGFDYCYKACKKSDPPAKSVTVDQSPVAALADASEITGLPRDNFEVHEISKEELEKLRSVSFLGGIAVLSRYLGLKLRFESSELQKNRTDASSHCSSVQERLVTYGSEALDSVEHLGLIVGSQKAADALLEHFGSLTVLARASVQELLPFVSRPKAMRLVSPFAWGPSRYGRNANRSPSTALWRPPTSVPKCAF